MFARMAERLQREERVSSYHHGDLPNALLSAVDEIVREREVAGLTLREVARRAGVTHAAPAHHFGDKAGMLTAFATEGFTMLREHLAAARAAESGAVEHPELLRVGLAYIRFAIAEPARFAVMFRPEQLRSDDPDYVAARDAAFAVLADTIRDLRTDLEPDSPEVLLAASGAWSIVHGFATLWLDGDLSEEITARPPGEAAEATLLQFGATLLASAGLQSQEAG